MAAEERKKVNYGEKQRKDYRSWMTRGTVDVKKFWERKLESLRVTNDDSKVEKFRTKIER